MSSSFPSSPFKLRGGSFLRKGEKRPFYARSSSLTPLDSPWILSIASRSWGSKREHRQEEHTAVSWRVLASEVGQQKHVWKPPWNLRKKHGNTPTGHPLTTHWGKEKSQIEKVKDQKRSQDGGSPVRWQGCGMLEPSHAASFLSLPGGKL